MVAGSCSKVEILGRTILELCHSTLNRGICAISKTCVVPKTSKTITAWWLRSNLKQMPLVMKCQINQKKQIFPNTNLDPLVKIGGYLQLRSFTFLRCTISIYDHFTPWQLVAVPKLQFLRKHCWHQMEQHRRTSFEPCREICNSGTCAISKTTMVASKTRNTITALRRLHSKQMRLVMKCQINHENSQIFRNTNLDPLEKTGGYLQLPTSPLCIILDHRSW